MNTILILLGLIICLNCIPHFTKSNFPKMERVITGILIVSLIIFLLFSILKLNYYNLIGINTFPIIALIFIISALLYLTLFKNTKKKILMVIVLIPLITLSMLTLIFDRTIKEFEINEKTKIIVTSGGPLSCGESIKLTEQKFWIFDKEIYHENSLCLQGINRIKIIKFDKDNAVFLIYHNGKMDSENPYKYKIENNNVW